MATPGLMYRIGGVLDPSFNGVLALSVVKSREAAEAQAAAFRKSAAQINATNLRGNLWQARKDEALAAGVAVDMSALAQYKRKLAETKAAEALFLTGSQVTRSTGMTERLAALRIGLQQGGDAAAKARAEIRMLAGAQGIGAVTDAISGGHGKVSMTGAIRETLVIFREIAAGRGWGRIASSATLLGQYLWKGFLGALLSIPGLVAAAGAAIAYFTYQHLKKINEALDKTAESMSHAFGDRAKANIDAMMEAARATGELKDRISELGKAHETLSDQLDESLRKMEEEFQMMRKIAQLKGETPIQEMAAEQAYRREQLEKINKALKDQMKLAADAKKADEDAVAAAFSSTEAKNRNSMLKDMPGQLHDAHENVKTLMPIVNELLQKQDENVAALNRNGMATQKEIDDYKRSFGDQNNITKSGESWTLNSAQSQLGLYQDLIKNLPRRMADLEEIQRQLASAQSKAASGDTKANDDVISLTKKRDALQDQIGLHDKYDKQTGLLKESRAGVHSDFLGLTSNQRAGAQIDGPAISLLDVQRAHLAVAKDTNAKLTRGFQEIGSKLAGNFKPKNYWGGK